MTDQVLVDSVINETNRVFNPVRVMPAVQNVDKHAMATDRYNVFDTREIIGLLDKHGWVPHDGSQVAARRSEDAAFKRHVIWFKHPDLNFGDEQLSTVIFNSHDRTTSMRFMMGIIRWVCSNLMIAGEGFEEFRMRHINWTQDDVLRALDGALENAPTLMNNVADMKELGLNKKDRVKFAIDAMKIRYPKVEALPFEPSLILDVRRKEDKDPTLWNTFNVVQESLLKGGVSYDRSTGKHSHNMTRPIRNVNEIVRVNRGLWDLAEETLQAAA